MSTADVQRAKRRLFNRIIAVAHLLDKPFTDQPELSPWDFIERDMAALDAAIGENDIAATGQCCCAGCAGMGPCDRDDRAQP